MAVQQNLGNKIQDLKKNKALKKGLHRIENGLAEAAAILISQKRIMPSGEKT